MTGIPHQRPPADDDEPRRFDPDWWPEERDNAYRGARALGCVLVVVMFAILIGAVVIGIATTARATDRPAYPYHVTVTWLLPATWDHTTTPPGNVPAIWPQTRHDGPVPACRWAQVDTYRIDDDHDQAVLDSLGDQLDVVNGTPADTSIYVRHVFVPGPPCTTTPTPAPEPTCPPTTFPTATPTPSPTPTTPPTQPTPSAPTTTPPTPSASAPPPPAPGPSTTPTPSSSPTTSTPSAPSAPTPATAATTTPSATSPAASPSTPTTATTAHPERTETSYAPDELAHTGIRGDQAFILVALILITGAAAIGAGHRGPKDGPR